MSDLLVNTWEMRIGQDAGFRETLGSPVTRSWALDIGTQQEAPRDHPSCCPGGQWVLCAPGTPSSFCQIALYLIEVSWFTVLYKFSSVQSLSRVRLFATPWIAARQASLSISNSWSLLKLMSIESVILTNHLILCRPLFLLPSIFPSIRVFLNESALHIR